MYLLILASIVSLLSGSRLVAPPATPMAHGVVFFCPEKADAAVAELKKIKADGFGLIEFASWCWTLPVPGSQLERTATEVLDWCDANSLSFVLMHNIQFGSKAEGGGLDDSVKDPLSAQHFLTDWLRVLKGHTCVSAVILGNEVGPVSGNPNADPAWWAAFVLDMRKKHSTINHLNAAWKSSFADFDSIEPPQPGTPGAVDISQFAATVFDRFYGTLFEKSVRPALLPAHPLCGCKCSGDPVLLRSFHSFDMLCWDDMVSDFPQWRLKALGDISRRTGKPVFNSELHLYNDSYGYSPSAQKSRYRYMLSALNREWMTASFAWGQWKKSEITAIHSETPETLGGLKRLEPILREFGNATPELHVLVTAATEEDVESQKLYTRLAGSGIPWEYVCAEDLGAILSGALFVPVNTRLSVRSIQALLTVPRSATIVLESRSSVTDEYGRPLSSSAEIALQRRALAAYGLAAVPATDSEKLKPPYSEVSDVQYASWSEKRGSFSYSLAYPKLEARQVKSGSRRIIAVINHATAGSAVRARLPWLSAKLRSVEEIKGDGSRVKLDSAQEVDFAPLDVRLFEYR